MIYYNETKNTKLWQKCQLYRTKKWHNHQILKSKIKLYTNNNPIQTIRSVDTEYKIKIKCLKITYQNQNTKIHYYSFDKSLILLKNGDIETNPGPMPNILETHPPPHRRRYKTYFITCTIKLHPEYQHLAKTFLPILKIDHPNHINATRNFPYLIRYLTQKRQHPAPRLLFVLITTISLDINSCEHQLINIPNQDWTSTLLDRMSTLRNPPERHINMLHPYTEFINNHKKMLNPPTTIRKEIFDFIHQETIPTTIHTLTKKFPFLPNSILNEALRIYEPLNKYSHPPPIPQIPPPPTPNVTQNTNSNTQIISWNASSLNTALPNLHDIIQHTNLAIIAIQETKLTATKSTKYIQNLFLHYKLIFNNTHALTRCIQQRIPYTPAREGLLTLINQNYTFTGNITKIPSPANISSYLQTISTKYIQNLFLHYKLIFNNTHALTRCIQQRIPYTPARRGLLTLINQNYTFLGNITKIPSPTNISSYLQTIHVKNYPLQPWLIIHLYMPSHIEDIRLIPTIQQTIKIQIDAHPNHTYILCGDFNRDIALIGRQNEQRFTPPQEEDLM